jgi:peptidoglycan-associated lipoprotein
MRSFVCIGLGLAAVAIAACSHDEPAPKTASSDVAVGITRPTSAIPPTTDQVMNVGPKLRQSCDIHDVNQAPKFDFDKSSLSTNDRDVLSKVAACLLSGPMKGHDISLVGRADPRGEAEYNMNLGEQRAGSAKAYLEQLGVGASRLTEKKRK